METLCSIYLNKMSESFDINLIEDDDAVEYLSDSDICSMIGGLVNRVVLLERKVADIGACACEKYDESLELG